MKQEPQYDSEEDEPIVPREYSEFSATTLDMDMQLAHLQRPLVPPAPPPIPDLRAAQTMLGQAIMEHREKKGGGILTTVAVAFAFLVAANYLD